MYAKYGNYRFDDDSVALNYTCAAKLDSGGVPYAYMPRYKLRGEVRIDDTGTVAGNQAAMTTKLRELEAAFSQQFKDFGFYDNSGRLTAHRLLNSETLGGVKVLTRIEYPDSTGAEYSTYRTFEVTLGGDVAITASNPNTIVNWAEVVEYQGTGGPRRVWTEFVEGDPQNDIVCQRTTIKCVQRGTARAIGAYPRPTPLYPLEVEHEDLRIWSPGTPEFMGNGVNAYYPASWAYFFEFANPQFQNPTGRPQ